MSPVNLSEKILNDAGGWQAMRQARALIEMGRVVSANYTPPVLKGLVREGEMEYRAGLKITTATNIENICSCRESRQWGKICAHSLAVGLALLRPKTPSVAESPKPAVPPSGPQFFVGENPNPVTLHIILPPSVQPAWEKGQVMVVVEAEHSGRRVLLQALEPQKSFSCAPEDLRVIEKIRELNDGQIAGMMILPREKFLEMLVALRGHPRVTLGKSVPLDASVLLVSLAPQASTKPAAPESTTDGPFPAPEFSLTIEGSLNHLGARLQAVYGKRILSVGSQSRGDSFPGRNLKAEEQGISRLKQSGFSGPDTSGQYILRTEARILAFFARELPALQREWNVSIGSRFETITGDIERIAPQIDIRGSGESWFDMTVSLSAPGGEHFSSAEIQRLLQMGQNHVRLKSGKIAVFDSGMLDELQNVLLDCNPQQQQPGTYRVSRVHAGYIDAAMGEGSGINLAGSPSWQQWSGSQRHLEKCREIPLGPMEEILRPYQKQGVYWMNFLSKNGFGGILADEMGLGKTVQALAFLQAVGGKTLIVCPSSLIYNWQREAGRFCPGLKVLCIQGANRHGLFRQIPDADLVVTSYPLLRRDIDQYRGIKFTTAILDEAQHIKNPDTQNALAASAIQAGNRFVLTGTPMENSVRDLWSVMNFVMPGYLGTRQDFKERYEVPLIRDQSSDQMRRLAKRLQPFMLRRLKKLVITELPEKIEQVTYCELTTQQTDIYKGLLSAARTEIDRATSEKGEGPGRLVMLTALLRLRQACCDLRLLGITDDLKGGESAKLDILEELLQEAMDGGHRILIFSQFVSMLTLLRERLDQLGVGFCYLDGKTKDRAAEVDRFQQSADIPVFLISLKAGGVGLNLTAADTVIHFDPWWNPAVEAQATDRAHRIGQNRVVTSYKLITKGTVEEKILNLQRKKREMIDAMVESDEPLMTGLSMEEIRGLLSD
jgi:superfamily II DNA or RNA helicase